MANLYLTHKCNRGCPFCFARKVLNESGGNVDELLTIDDIKTLLAHFPGQFREIGLLGGEPFLYPYLGEALELLWQQHIVPKIFTSATNPLPASLRDIDVGKHPLNFVVNIGTRDSYTDEKYQNLIDFFTKFHAVSSLSYTILDLDANPSFLFDIIDRFQLFSRSVRVGVALPIYKGGNQYVSKEDYQKLGKFFVTFAGMAHERNVILGMDCGFTACMFTPTEVGALQRSGVRFSFACGAAVDIGPGLKAWNCFPLFQLHKENVLESKNMRELIRKFDTNMHEYFNRRVGIFRECDDCKYLKRRACQGGCKSFKSI
jgi:sulfatase maturation enzyme AslB (radical SAM superfamily)